jgi:hypothetical protein
MDTIKMPDEMNRDLRRVFSTGRDPARKPPSYIDMTRFFQRFDRRLRKKRPRSRHQSLPAEA